jgi:nitroimidazol reductase NimA-like FMN-containing flavoprotein (pyridoxamine 5'-phosphate oxidase superfamily)
MMYEGKHQQRKGRTMHDKIRMLIAANDVCVLATVAGETPHCSLMSYAADADGNKFYMTTHKTTKKFRNMEDNPTVSLLIDSREVDQAERRPRAQALTVSGRYTRAGGEEEKREIRERLLARHPHLERFIDHPDTEFIIVRATAFQLLDGVMDAYYEQVED